MKRNINLYKLISFLSLQLDWKSHATELYNLGLSVIPYPQEVIVGGENFNLPDKVYHCN